MICFKDSIQKLSCEVVRMYYLPFVERLTGSWPISNNLDDRLRIRCTSAIVER